MNRKMPWFATILVALLSLQLASCRSSENNQGSKAVVSQHYLQAQHDYCSTNIYLAERGLSNYIQWLSDSNNPCEPVLNRNFVIFHEYGRWFLIKEYLGETNNSEFLYQKSLQAFDAYLKNTDLSDTDRLAQIIHSKEELRKRLEHQDRGLDVGWRRQ